MRQRTAWVALMLISNSVSALASMPPCVARARVEPASAVVGQQVIWKVQIDSRDDVAEISWVDTPAFANIRTERLPGLPVVPRVVPGAVPPSSVDSPPSGEWDRYTTREEQRALFPERAGVLSLTSAGLLCKLENGMTLDTRLPAVTLNVLAVPESDRPEHFTGVVGPLVLDAHAEPNQLALGGTIRVTVSIRGAGNLWDIGDLLGSWNPIEADVFARKPQLELRRGTQLSVQKIFRYDVVPRSVGPFSIPPVQLNYFDPLEARYWVARSPRLEISVSPAQATPATSAQPAGARPAASLPARNTPSRPILLLALFVAVAAGIALWRWRRQSRQSALATPSATGDADHDAAELARALRSALATHRGQVESESTDESMRPDDRREAASEAAELLETLERSRFDPNTKAPERDIIDRALARLDRALRQRP